MLDKKILKDIYKHIEDNTVSYIVAPTGTGKSRNIPPALIKYDPESVVLIAVPTVTAAISISKGVKESNPDLKIEYAAGGEVKYKKDTQIIYATYGHVKNKMKKYFNDGVAQSIEDFDYLIIDESHTRDKDSDMIWMLWEEMYRQAQSQSKNNKIKYPKLIFMSATAPQKEEYEIDITPKPEKYIVKLSPYRVKVDYISNQTKFDKSKIDIELIKKHVIKQHEKYDIEDGPFLVFLPGVAEVEELRDILNEDKNDDMYLLTAYGNMAKDDIDKIFEDAPEGKRKIILATNIAESAITIEDLLLVIDSMFERRIEMNDLGNNKLELHLISKDSAEQRKGRTGRKKRNIVMVDSNGVSETYDGFVLRVIPEESYEELEDTKTPEIERVNIDKEVIEMFSIKLDPRILFPKNILKDVKKSIFVLEKIKALENDKKEIIVTDLGDFISNLPLGVKMGAALYFWIFTLEQPAFPGLILSTLIDNFGPSYFWYPGKESKESITEYNARLKKITKEHHSRFIGKDNLETLLNMWQTMAMETGYIAPDRKKMVEWCKENYINNKKLREFTNIIMQIYNVLIKYTEVDLGSFDTERVVRYFNSILVEILDDNVMTRLNNGRYKNKDSTFTLGGVKYSVPRKDELPGKILAVSIFNTSVSLFSVIDQGKGQKTEKEEINYFSEEDSDLSSEEESNDFFSDEE